MVKIIKKYDIESALVGTLVVAVSFAYLLKWVFM